MVQSAVESIIKEKRCKDSRCCGFEYDLIVDDGMKKKWNGWKKSLTWRITLATLKLMTVVCIVIFVIFPLVFKFCYALQRAVVFLNFVNLPPNPDYSHPEKYGLQGSRNFYINTEPNVKVGVWQILPESLIDTSNDTNDEFWENILSDGQNVIIYNHGNAGCRLTGHRVEIYKVLRKHGHVFAWDYRSYGDSSNVDPTEELIVRDVMFFYEWVANRTKGNVFVWGHSLGTSLTTHAMSRLKKDGRMPTGLILESPFNNMREEISEFPLARLFRNLPWFSFTVIEPMQENNFKFETDRHICNVDVPIMILHAVDDNVVPFKLGYKLYERAQKCRNASQGKIIFHSFSKSHGYGHKYICRDPNLDEKIQDFIADSIEEMHSKKIEHKNNV